MKAKNQVIYQIFVRNYSKEGTFKEVSKDLPRIKDLGSDVIYLMPIHEIGEENRKGTWGSPYAIKDYFSISPDLGTLDDLKELINKTHELGMKIILDMVFNHTSPDNVLVTTHPEYYFYKNGKRGNRVGDWTDIVDLDTPREDVQDYLVSVLKYWLDVGVDGFRFDVASTIPLSLFEKARKILGNKPIFFGECVSEGFAKYLQSVNAIYAPDKDLMGTFDYLYNYNWMDKMIDYFNNQGELKAIVDAINNDDKNIIRVNGLENHDKDRTAHLCQNEEQLKEWIKFSFALKGHVFIYMGEEYGIKHKPDLFEKDPVIWPKENEIYHLFKALIKEKHLSDVIDNNLIYKDNIVCLNNKEYKL